MTMPNPSTDWPSSLTDNELESLDRFLRAQADNDALLLDGVHGLLTALTVGPQPALPEEWLPLVLHAPFNDAGEGNQVLQLLAKLNDSIPVELDVDAYEPILGEVDDIGGKVLSAAGWCEGFSTGIDLRAGLWEQRLSSDPQLMELLGPIMALAVDEGVLSAEAEFEKLSEDEYEDCLIRLPEVLTAVARYWREHAPSQAEREAAHARQAADVGASRESTPRHRGSHSLH